MRKIFVFWILFLVVLAIGVILAISSKVTLRREEKRAEKLRKVVISRPSRLPKQPVAPEAKTETVREAPKETTEAALEAPKETAQAAPAEPAPAVASPSSSVEMPPLKNDIPVEINTNSLEMSIPPPALQDEPVSQAELPAAGQ